MKRKKILLVSLGAILSILLVICITSSIGSTITKLEKSENELKLGQPIVKFTEDCKNYYWGYEFHKRTLQDNIDLEKGDLPEDITYVEAYSRWMPSGLILPANAYIKAVISLGAKGWYVAETKVPGCWSSQQNWVSWMRHYYYDIGPSDDEKGLWTSASWFFLPSVDGGAPVALYIMLDNHDHRNGQQVDVVGCLYFGPREARLDIGTDDAGGGLLTIAENVPVVYDEWFYMSTTINTVTNEYVEVVYSVPSEDYTFTMDPSKYSLSGASANIKEDAADQVWLYAGAVSGYESNGASSYTLYIDYWQGTFEPYTP